MKSKTQLAFEWSIDELYKVSHMHGRRLYFWTFTFRECLDVHVARKLWSELLNRLRKKRLRMFGVRRFEMHPNGHGVHVHMILDERIDVNTIRPMAQAIGFGRIHVVRLGLKDLEKTCKYMTKYMAKEDRPECLKGVRLWANCGGFKGCMVKNIKTDSPFTRFYYKVKKMWDTNRPLAEAYLQWYMRTSSVDPGYDVPINFDWMDRNRRNFFYTLLYIFNDFTQIDEEATFAPSQFVFTF